MIFAYADPPYVGQAKKLYGEDEIDHAELIGRLANQYPDGWALSASTPSLRELLPLCPPDVRIMAWVKPFAVFKPNVGVAYAWEPVLVHGGRRRGRDIPTVRDWVSANITLKKGLVGAKPEAFYRWLLEVWNYQADVDEVVDLFPGTATLMEVVARVAGLREVPTSGETAEWVSRDPPDPSICEDCYQSKEGDPLGRLPCARHALPVQHSGGAK